MATGGSVHGQALCDCRAAREQLTCIVHVSGVEQLVFKHAIATVARVAPPALHEARA